MQEDTSVLSCRTDVPDITHRSAVVQLHFLVALTTCTGDSETQTQDRRCSAKHSTNESRVLPSTGIKIKIHILKEK